MRDLESKQNKCIADLLVLTGVGFSVGVLASFLVFRRSKLPVALTTGFGLGMGYADCVRAWDINKAR